MIKKLDYTKERNKEMFISEAILIKKSINRKVQAYKEIMNIQGIALLLFHFKPYDSYIETRSKKELKRYFDQIGKYLLSQKSKFITTYHRERLFRVFTLCYYYLKSEDIFIEARYKPTLKDVFKKLSDKSEWAYNDITDKKKDLSLLTVYLEAVSFFHKDFRLWASWKRNYPYSDKKGTNYLYFKLAAQKKLSFNPFEELLVNLNKEDLYSYFKTRGYYDVIHKTSLNQLDLFDY